jgi:NAD(P)-dependent dehydrogenase (short-subunit alcohol dehydrogenase family)
MAATRQVAIVTGASSGIGKAAAIALAGAGFQVIGTARNTARLTAPAGVTYLDLDVTSDESVASLVKQVIDRFGQIDVLVNNAGVGANGAAEEFSVARTQDVFDINVYGVMRMTKAVLPHMRATRCLAATDQRRQGCWIPCRRPCTSVTGTRRRRPALAATAAARVRSLRQRHSRSSAPNEPRPRSATQHRRVAPSAGCTRPGSFGSCRR